MQPIIEYGDFTYGVPKINGEGIVKVGKFCSIAEDVKFILWGHHTDFFSTYPLGHTSTTLDCPRFESHPIKGSINIGNDVWIGDGATIQYGVTIGDGAIISARSYITRNVKPYTVVGGNPAEFLYTRFNKNIVDLLLKLKWWDLPYDVIRENSHILMSNDYDKLLDFYNRVRGNKKLYVVSCCYNEEKILPFYLDYYTNFIKADKIIIYDGGSTDNTPNIVKDYPNVEFIVEDKGKMDERNLKDIRNNGWKKYKNNYDWVIVCDMDEFIYHPNLRELLTKYDNEQITVPKVDGYDMISKEFPKFKKGKFLPSLIQNGIHEPIWLNKSAVFKPNKVDINYDFGTHSCSPTGEIKHSENADIKLLQYKWLSHEYVTDKSLKASQRLSDWNLETGMASHYKEYAKITDDDFNKKLSVSTKIITDFPERNISIFWHCYLINNWYEIMEEQMKLIKKSGLYEKLKTCSIHLCYHGDDEQWNKMMDLISEYDEENKIICHYIDKNFYEYPTLQKLYEYAKESDDYILYLHLKGVWSSTDVSKNKDAITSWRKCLEYFNIEKWEDCIDKLNEGYEVVSALYNYNDVHPLFSGNIWWTTSEYINKLKYPDYDPSKNPYLGTPEDDGTWCRVECEKWINTIPNKFYNFYVPKDYGFYYIPIEEKDYRKNTDYKISVIIPTYNRLNSLTECIDSVIHQNYQNLEILVCHDGPSDMFNSFKFDDDRISYYTTDKQYNNLGAAQRNMMIPKITGDYVLFLDDDNVLYENYIQKMVEQITPDTGLVVCHIHFNDKKWKDLILPRKDELVPCEIDHLSILFKNEIAKGFTWDNDWGQDHRYIKACEKLTIEKGLKIKYIPDILANHRYLGKKDERPIVIFNHNYLIGNWENIVKEQLSLLKKSGLYDECTSIYSYVTVKYEHITTEQDKFEELIKQFDNQNKVKIRWNKNNNFEYDCLQGISEFSEGNPSDICYFHTKGVYSETIIENIGVKSWRDYLNYFTITRWKDNVEKLKEGYDVVGVNYDYNDMHNDYVIGGNFFWTKSEYVKTLPYPNIEKNRFNAERWILKNKDRKVFELFNTSKLGIKNLYMEFLNPNLYQNFSIEDIVNKSFEKYGTQQNKWEYVEFFKRLVEKGKTGSVLEIGSKYGGTTYGFCNLFEKVVSIDIFKEEQINEIESKYKNLTFILGDSHSPETRSKLNDMKFDVVFIDGDHHYDAVKQDYLDYKSFCKDDGIIVFHDIKQTSWTDSVEIQVPKLWNEIKNDYKYEEIINDENDCFGIGLLFNNKKKDKKPIVVMTSHPNYKMSEDITKLAIQSFKGRDVILSSHCPVSVEIQKMVKYFVYDKNNPLIRHDYYNQSWFNTDDYYSLIKLHYNDNDLQHALAVYINYYNSIMYAKSLGYTTAVCTNFDLIFSEQDLKLIDQKIDQMYKEGKKSFYMTSKANEGIHYKTIFFITDVDFFLNNFKYVTNENDYNKLTREVGSSTNCLENFFYETLKNSKELLLQEIHEKEFFSTSKIDIFSNIEYFTVLPLRDDDESFVVWFSSSNSMDNRNVSINVLKGMDVIYTHSQNIGKDYRFYKIIKFEKGYTYQVILKVFYDDKITTKEIFVNDDIMMNKIKNYGEFWKKSS